MLHTLSVAVVWKNRFQCTGVKIKESGVDEEIFRIESMIKFDEVFLIISVVGIN